MAENYIGDYDKSSNYQKVNQANLISVWIMAPVGNTNQMVISPSFIRSLPKKANKGNTTFVYFKAKAPEKEGSQLSAPVDLLYSKSVILIAPTPVLFMAMTKATLALENKEDQEGGQEKFWHIEGMLFSAFLGAHIDKMLTVKLNGGMVQYKDPKEFGDMGSAVQMYFSYVCRTHWFYRKSMPWRTANPQFDPKNNTKNNNDGSLKRKLEEKVDTEEEIKKKKAKLLEDLGAFLDEEDLKSLEAPLAEIIDQMPKGVVNAKSTVMDAESRRQIKTILNTNALDNGMEVMLGDDAYKLIGHDTPMDFESNDSDRQEKEMDEQSQKNAKELEQAKEEAEAAKIEMAKVAEQMEKLRNQQEEMLKQAQVLKELNEQLKVEKDRLAKEKEEKEEYERQEREANKKRKEEEDQKKAADAEANRKKREEARKKKKEEEERRRREREEEEKILKEQQQLEDAKSFEASLDEASRKNSSKNNKAKGSSSETALDRIFKSLPKK